MKILRWARRRGSLLAGLVAISVAVAACGSSGSGGSSGSAGASPAADLLGKPNPATGSTVTLGFISASSSDSPLAAQFQRIEQGLQMSLKYVNQYRGGIGGHRVALFICQGNETPSGTQDCANQMVNHNVAATITPFSGQGSSIVPIITAAHIPYVAISGASSEELTKPGAFALTGSFPSTLAGYASYARDHGVKKFAMLAIDVPAVLQAVGGLGSLVFKNAGVGFQAVPVPVGTADLTPQLQAAVKGGADAVGLVGDLTFCSSFLQGYQTLGLDLPKYLINTCIDPTTVKAYSSVIKGSVMAGNAAGETPTADEKLYGAIAKTFDKKVDPDPNVSIGQAAGVTTLLSFINLFKNFTGDPTPAAILELLKTTKEVPLFSSGGATYTCDGKAIPLLPNICSADVTVGVTDGEGKIQKAQLIDTTALFGT